MRQFIAEDDLDSSGCLRVEGKKSHYLTNVLRLQVGDMVDVRLKDSTLVQMTLSRIDKSHKYVLLQLAASRRVGPLPQKNDANIYLFQFVAKPAKMDLIIRQAVECGLAAVILVEGDFCQKGPVEAAKKHGQSDSDRWQKIITEARQQSGSPVETKIFPCLPVEKALDLWQNQFGKNGCGIVLYERTEQTQPLHKIIWENKDAKNFALFVGAEGGISPKEIDTLCRAGIFPVHFNTNILRCETAALYGLAALQCTQMEQNIWQFKE